MKNLTFKRILTILLTLCLTLSLIPCAVVSANDITLRIENANITTQAGDLVIKVTLNVENTDSGLFVVTAYNDNKRLNAAFQDMGIGKVLTVKVPKKSEYTIKAFLWKDIDSMQPLAQSDETAVYAHLVDTAEDLLHVGKPTSNGSKYDSWTLGAYYIQTSDINMEYEDFTAIGDFSKPFTGMYSGGGNIISNLTISASDEDNQGLFGYIGADGTVQNIGLVGGSISGQDNVGSVAGVNAGTVQNCYSTGTVSSTSSEIGGVAGINNGTVQNCIALNPSVTTTFSTNVIGRVVGKNSNGTLTNNYAFSGMTVTTKGAWTPAKTVTGKDGANIAVANAKTQATWTTAGFIFDATHWTWDADGDYMPSLHGKKIAWPGHLFDTSALALADAVTGDSLKNAFSRYFSIGVAIAEKDTATSNVVNMIKYQYNSITFSNELTPESLLVQSDSKNDPNGYPCIDEAKIDRVLTFAKNNNLRVRGNALVWHNHTPEWFFRENYSDNGDYVSKEVMRGRMEQYIKKVVTYCQIHYPDVVYAWDVVNEAILDSGDYRDATAAAPSNWYRVYGDESYIEDAFSFARNYTQGTSVKRFYNDNNTYITAKRTTIFDMVKDLYEKGLLDGMGMQSHVTMTSPDISAWQETINEYGAIGIELHLTELDVHNTDNSASGDTALKDRYVELIDVVLQAKRAGRANITNVTFWGLNDSETWLTTVHGEASYPLLFDSGYNKKEAYGALIELAQQY